ncbi:hypothetical protein H0E87_009587, partial [Populus deltoides]
LLNLAVAVSSRTDTIQSPEKHCHHRLPEDGLCTEEWRDKDFEGGKVYLACCPQVSESQSSAAVPALECC